MRVKSLMLGCLAAGLLVGAPQAMALDVDVSLVVDVDSSSGDVTVDADVCMQAVLELINDQGFELRSSSPVGVLRGPDLTSYLFTKRDRLDQLEDVATLYCIANINLNPGGGCGPGGPGGPGGC
jgi:hypothetical protein